MPNQQNVRGCDGVVDGTAAHIDESISDRSTDMAPKPHPFPSARQNLLHAINHGTYDDVAELLSSTSLVATVIDEPNVPKCWYEYPVTPLSVAIGQGREDIIRLLVQRGQPRDLQSAVRFERSQLLKSLRKYWRSSEGSMPSESSGTSDDSTDDEACSLPDSVCMCDPPSPPQRAELNYSYQWRQTTSRTNYSDLEDIRSVQNLTPFSLPNDATTIALRSLLFTQGDGQAIFSALCTQSFCLNDAQYCDAGRCLWFWAARKGHINILDALLKAGFPIDFRATGTSVAYEDCFRCGLMCRGASDIEVAPINTTALWNAAWKGSAESVGFLLQHGAKLDLEEDFADQNYHQSCQNNQNASSYVLNELLAACQGLFFANALQFRRLFWDWDERSSPKPDQEQYATVVLCLLQRGANANTCPSAQPRLAGRKDIEIPLLPVLLQLSALGALTAVKHLIHYGANPEMVCSKGKTLLHYALRSGDIALTRMILQYKSLINRSDFQGHSPLHECVSRGTADLLRLLIEHGAAVETLTVFGLSPLLIAVNLNEMTMVRTLLEHGANANYSLERSFSFETPLDIGNSLPPLSINGGSPIMAVLLAPDLDLELVQLLLRHGADPMLPAIITNVVRSFREADRIDETDDHFWAAEISWKPPYLLAAQLVAAFSSPETKKKRSDVFKEIVVAVEPQFRSRALLQPFLDDCLRALCKTNLPVDWLDNYQHISLRKGIAYEAVEFLLDKGANPRVRGSQGLTPLHVACSGDSGCHDSEENAAIIQGLILKLVKLGADLNALDDMKRTPLHYAAVHRTDVLSTLLQLGAKFSYTDIMLRTPLQYACGLYNRQSASVRILLAQNYEGYVDWGAILRAACRRNDDTNGEADLIDEIIRKASNSPCNRRGKTEVLCMHDKSGETAVHVACRRPSPAPLKGICKSSRLWRAFHMQENSGRTPLIIAALSRDAEKVRLLLHAIRISHEDSQTNIISKDRFRTCDAYFHDMEETMPQPVRFTEIEEGGRNDQVRSVAGNEEKGGADGVSRNISVLCGSIVWASIVCGPQKLPPTARAQCLNMRDNFGWTALHYAARAGQPHIVQLLVVEPGMDLGQATGCCVPSPLELALDSKNSKCVMLINHALVQRRARQKEDFGEAGKRDPATKKPQQLTKLSSLVSVFFVFVQLLEVRIALSVCCILWISFWLMADDEPRVIIA